MAKWTLTDNAATPNSYTFEINPDTAQIGGGKKSVQVIPTTAPNGQSVKFEGRRQPDTMRFSGTLITQAQYDALNIWARKKNQVLLTDDLGRQFWIYITNFTPSRQLSRSTPWKHTFSLDATILDWPS